MLQLPVEQVLWLAHCVSTLHMPEKQAPAAHAYTPQVPCVPCGSPLATLVQVPTEPATSHATHAPVLQAVSQHTPSTQLPPAHSALRAHPEDWAFCGTHWLDAASQ